MSYRRGQRPAEAGKGTNTTHSNIFGGPDGERPPRKVSHGSDSTNEHKGKPIRKTSGRKAPDGVPRLEFGNVIEKDDAVVKRQSNRNGNQSSTQGKHPPVTVSVVSPSRQPRKRSGELSSGRPKKHDFVPNLELDLSASSDALQAMREAANDVYRDIKIEYASTAPGINLLNQNQLSRQRKQQIVEETLLADQLNGVSISKSRLTQSANPARHHGTNHLQRPTSSSSAAQNDLSKRLRFGARILTRSDRDALREINGFFFASDSSITMYEFRQFGTRSSALPFIMRGMYSHLHGWKRNQPYCLQDISVGSELEFDTKPQSSLPDLLRQEPSVSFVITDIDESAKENLLYDGCQNPRDRAMKADQLESYEHENKEQSVFLRRIQRATQAILLKRVAVKALIGVRKCLMQMDKTGSGMVSGDQVMSVLKKFRLEISSEDLNKLIAISGGHDYSGVEIHRFLRYFFGDMNETRKGAVRRAFMKVDHAKTGVVRTTEIGRFYLARNHPAVVSGKRTESEERKSLLASFADTQISGEVTFSEFADYCESVSLVSSKDEHFLAFMQQLWAA